MDYSSRCSLEDGVWTGGSLSPVVVIRHLCRLLRASQSDSVVRIAYQCQSLRRCGFEPGREILWRRKWQAILVFLGIPWTEESLSMGLEELDTAKTTEYMHLDS